MLANFKETFFSISIKTWSLGWAIINVTGFGYLSENGIVSKLWLETCLRFYLCQGKILILT